MVSAFVVALITLVIGTLVSFPPVALTLLVGFSPPLGRRLPIGAVT